MTVTPDPGGAPRPRWRGIDRLLFVALPLFFASNMVIGRSVVTEVGPWTLAWLRWSGAALILLVIVRGDLWRRRRQLAHEWRAIAAAVFFGMVVCGGCVYLGLRYTTAANATLIYASSNVFVLVIEAVLWGRRIALRQWAGVALAWAGVAVVMVANTQGAAGANHYWGDGLMVLAALGWAAYPILLRRPAFAALPGFTLFAAIAIAGALLCFVPAAVEFTTSDAFPKTHTGWAALGALILVPSILGYRTYQSLVGRFGAGRASGFIYLVPAYGVALAALLLGEPLTLNHFAGFAMIVGGLALVSLAS